MWEDPAVTTVVVETTTVEHPPLPICEPGWQLAEDLTCVPPGYYDPPVAAPAPSLSDTLPATGMTRRQRDDAASLAIGIAAAGVLLALAARRRGVAG